MKLRNPDTKADWKAIKQLYRSAFPLNEKKPFWLIKSKYEKGQADVWVIEKENSFAGMAITMNGGDLVLLDYFAVCADKRSGGIGGEALKSLQEKYSDRRFFLEIESVDKPSPKLPERLRRKKFYLTNGMQEMGVNVKLFGVDMELLGYNCAVSFEEYRNLYLNTYGNWAARNVVDR
ncbi:MAG: GNAT family N-acetyltransferase [Lachnospiraceae bacterium]|nr:GNAT family N-acetyltransferase [Lachnospiraceae bacterium]